jgi:hypothetical protein
MRRLAGGKQHEHGDNQPLRRAKFAFVRDADSTNEDARQITSKQTLNSVLAYRRSVLTLRMPHHMSRLCCKHAAASCSVTVF